MEGNGLFGCEAMLEYAMVDSIVIHARMASTTSATITIFAYTTIALSMLWVRLPRLMLLSSLSILRTCTLVRIFTLVSCQSHESSGGPRSQGSVKARPSRRKHTHETLLEYFNGGVKYEMLKSERIDEERMRERAATPTMANCQNTKKSRATLTSFCTRRESCKKLPYSTTVWARTERLYDTPTSMRLTALCWLTATGSASDQGSGITTGLERCVFAWCCRAVPCYVRVVVKCICSRKRRRVMLISI